MGQLNSSTVCTSPYSGGATETALVLLDCGMMALERITSLLEVLRCPGMTVSDLEKTLQEWKAGIGSNDG